MFNLEEELKKLPDKPGVYIMHDKIGTIIYVGKAVNLKNRVRQYFRASTKHTAKIKRMVSNRTELSAKNKTPVLRVGCRRRQGSQCEPAGRKHQYK